MSDTAMIPRNRFMAVSTDPKHVAALAAIRENMDGDFRESDLIRVKNPSGGSLMFEIDSPDGVTAASKIVGVIVYRAKLGVLWPTEKQGDQKPVLTTEDMKVATLRVKEEEVPADIWAGIKDSELTIEEIRKDPKYRAVPDDNLPRLFWWSGEKAIPYVNYGTSTKGDGRGKRAKEYQVLYVLREGDVFPLKLRMGPTSLGPTRKYLVKMTDMPYHRAVTEISLKQEKTAGGDAYSVAQFKRVGVLEEEAHIAIVENFVSKIRAGYETGAFSAVNDADGAAE